MIGPTAQTLAAFNLLCTGTHTSGKLNSLGFGDDKYPAQIIFRIDLNRGRWCSGPCETTSPIFSVTDTRIVLRQAVDKTLGTDEVTTISRESGEFIDRDRSLVAGTFTMTMGTCERRPFSGFPARRF